MIKINSKMFSVIYLQNGNKVFVNGINPLTLDENYEGEMTFCNQESAKGFCLAVETIKAAVAVDYFDEFAVLVNEDVIEITTLKPLGNRIRSKVEERVKKTLDVMPIAKKVKFYSLSK